MSLNHAPQTVTPSEYERIFALEQARAYWAVDVFEQRIGFAVDRERLEAAARVLECPFKAQPPNWQHGRVLYAVARHYLQGPRDAVNILDIGTAKGFSALCLLWALIDSGRAGQVTSVDVLPPSARVRRNTIAEVDRLQTLPEILAPWPEAGAIHFEHSSSLDWLQRRRDRVHLAFVDGKHDREVVTKEAMLLALDQQSGDVTVFDDVQMPGVRKAVESLGRVYDVEYLELGVVNREYAIGVRK